MALTAHQKARKKKNRKAKQKEMQVTNSQSPLTELPQKNLHWKPRRLKQRSNQAEK